MNPQFDHFLVWLDKSTRSGINSFARSFVRRKSYVSRRLSAFPIEASTWQAKENSEVMSAAIRSLQDILSQKKRINLFEAGLLSMKLGSAYWSRRFRSGINRCLPVRAESKSSVSLYSFSSKREWVFPGAVIANQKEVF